MQTPRKTDRAARLVLDADSAADLMTPNPISISAKAPVAEAIKVLTDRGINALPVIDEAGRPVGVLSKADILVHEREITSAPCPPGGQVGAPADRSRVSDLMTPAVFSVTTSSPPAQVITELVGLNVHQLFVVDENHLLVGVISALDVLRHLRPEE